MAALLAALFSVPAIAGENDALHLYASVGWSHDDNLLRVPDGDPCFDHRRGDSWLSAEGGKVFDHMYSRQRVAAVAKLSRATFDHFRQLDYDGKDLQTTGYWQLGDPARHLQLFVEQRFPQRLDPVLKSMP